MRKLRQRLADIVSYGSSVVTLLEGQSFEAFDQDADLHDLVYFRFLCISEAVRNVLLLCPELAERYPVIAWTAIRALGNVLRHEYGDIDATIIWQTVEGGDLTALISAAQQELMRLDA